MTESEGHLCRGRASGQRRRQKWVTGTPRPRSINRQRRDAITCPPLSSSTAARPNLHTRTQKALRLITSAAFGVERASQAAASRLEIFPALLYDVASALAALHSGWHQYANLVHPYPGGVFNLGDVIITDNTKKKGGGGTGNNIE